MSAAEHLKLKPYKGTESYQVEDAELFFGRKPDAEQLLARVLSARMTLLHGQSRRDEAQLRWLSRAIEGLLATTKTIA